MTNKPTGKIGFWHIKRDNNQISSSSIEYLKFPTNKEEIETLIIEIFCRALDQNKCFKLLSPPIKLTEHDIDFHVDTSLGEMGIELVEDAPLNKVGYKGLKSKYASEERYKHLKNLIQNKSKKYETYVKTKVKSLIIYSTDNKMGLIDSIIALVIKYCYTNEMNFDYIFYLNPRPDLTCLLCLFYPQTKEIINQVLTLNETELRKNGYIQIL